MKKSGLQDMKRENLRLIMSVILEKESVSRIELSEIIGLSPSTVSSLTSELMEKGWIEESGIAVSTGGRKRTELSINKNKGYIAVLEIGWRRAVLHFMDLSLEKGDSVILSDYYITGNELLEKVIQYLKEDAENLCNGQLAGIGLLFQEDMNPSDFNVMYSTSLSSDTISFCEAVKTQFKVPVIEEYSQVYSFRQILEREESANSAHIEIGKKVFVSITANGTLLDMSSGKKADMTPFVETEDKKITSDRLTEGIVNILQMICMLFPIENVYLSGRLTEGEDLAKRVSGQLRKKRLIKQAVEIRAVKPVINHMETDLGMRVLKKVIYEM
ncbi:winged helix-turn-helix transcriptional regulator [Lacrimispora saccharolytica]|uniref:Uncharacterized protein n=1 Tax=Lacrimispora saccharolytica (strain ATCC 35040 / DSM 2544 / NRCC 2533 / WM1) TaxID=610130 RepID=D9R3M3_LACSW|nr:winged helix-turn-helix transcriptional regulator [Lacrimispora saccharolytica]ADL06744.1 hypothetical protein Closa_4243 [[Clostridium] saccharolyticum WM1]QRV19189.1 winged helix-turn-helix transcriptional regulator [Lacrimispora saccharolytica]